MPTSKFTAADLKEMARLRQEGLSYQKIGIRFGCGYSNVMYLLGYCKPHKVAPKRHLLKDGWSTPFPKKIQKEKFIPPPKGKNYKEYCTEAEGKEIIRDSLGNILEIRRKRVFGVVN